MVKLFHQYHMDEKNIIDHAIFEDETDLLMDEGFNPDLG
eukprot:CAMPEP_0116883842 /NCGR_PEP_ID=MMETSP0463-20121206/16510_1 /TAXON_ID=181622 /ORGANISM="Strombidinopsis sp, Strain SopsisLIS2011" /LENGTH=38 /DNA_ID= /DNA_START= /DNA_END= /DNA_ORIENTATION=